MDRKKILGLWGRNFLDAFLVLAALHLLFCVFEWRIHKNEEKKLTREYRELANKSEFLHRQTLLLIPDVVNHSLKRKDTNLIKILQNYGIPMDEQKTAGAQNHH